MFGNLAKALLTHPYHRSAHSRPPDSGCPMEKKTSTARKSLYSYILQHIIQVIMFTTFLALQVTTTLKNNEHPSNNINQGFLV